MIEYIYTKGKGWHVATNYVTEVDSSGTLWRLEMRAPERGEVYFFTSKDNNDPKNSKRHVRNNNFTAYGAKYNGARYEDYYNVVVLTRLSP